MNKIRERKGIVHEETFKIKEEKFSNLAAKR